MTFRIHNAIARLLFLVGVITVEPAMAVTPADLAARIARNEPVLIIDVRSAIAYAGGHVPGAINIPLGLLPHKQLPAGLRVVAYGDGLGVIDDAQALAVLRGKSGASAEVLQGGYAAWLGETRLSTVLPGVTPENLPGITYDQLLAAGKSEMVLVDLRAPGAAALAAVGARKERQVAAAPAPDLLAAFAAKIGVPVVASSGSVEVAVARAQSAPLSGAVGPARAAAPATPEKKSARLLVLVADSDSAASEVARQLRASGEYRFTILIGGTESILHEGRVGSGRTDGAVPRSDR